MLRHTDLALVKAVARHAAEVLVERGELGEAGDHTLGIEFGRIAVSEIQAPNMLGNMV